MDISSRGVEILLVASCYRNRDKIRPDEPLGSYADFMYQSNRSFNIPPGIPRAFDAFSCSVGRAFDHHSLGVRNLIANIDVMLRVALIPRGLINHGGDGGDKL